MRPLGACARARAACAIERARGRGASPHGAPAGAHSNLAGAARRVPERVSTCAIWGPAWASRQARGSGVPHSSKRTRSSCSIGCAMPPLLCTSCAAEQRSSVARAAGRPVSVPCKGHLAMRGGASACTTPTPGAVQSACSATMWAPPCSQHTGAIQRACRCASTAHLCSQLRGPLPFFLRTHRASRSNNAQRRDAHAPWCSSRTFATLCCADRARFGPSRPLSRQHARGPRSPRLRPSLLLR